MHMQFREIYMEPAPQGSHLGHCQAAVRKTPAGRLFQALLAGRAAAYTRWHKGSLGLRKTTTQVESDSQERLQSPCHISHTSQQTAHSLVSAG